MDDLLKRLLAHTVEGRTIVQPLMVKVNQHQAEQQLKNLKLEILAFLKNYLDIDINHKTPVEALQQLGQLIDDMKDFEKIVRKK